MPTDELLSVCDVADGVRGGEMTAVEMLELYRRATEARNPDLNAFVYVDWEAALHAARLVDAQVRRGEDLGLLAGVPLGVKDLEDCAGMPTCLGSRCYQGTRPALLDSIQVGRARRAGAVPIGKTAVPEFGLASITSSPAWGITRNPWGIDLSPGGSSGGSAAAVAAGMVPLATGTDAGGSIRSPAAFTGLVGLKPSHGRIGESVRSDVSVSGCLSLTVRDTARFLDVVAGPVAADPTSLPSPIVCYERAIEELQVVGLRAAWSDDMGFAPTAPECAEVARQAAHDLVVAGSLSWTDRGFRIRSVYEGWALPFLADIRGGLELDGVWPDRMGELSPAVRERLAVADRVSARALAGAARARRQIETRTSELFNDVDVLFTPTTAVVSLPAAGPVPEAIGGLDAKGTGAEPHLPLANLAWLPAISVPAGLSASGLPVGLQIVCARGRDDLVLRLARILEQARPWPRGAPGYRGMRSAEQQAAR